MVIISGNFRSGNPVSFWTVCASANTNHIVLLGFAIIPTALCYSTWQEAYKRIEPTYVRIIYSLDPLTAFALGFIFFHQDVIVSQIIGILLILAAIANLVIAESKQEKESSKRLN